MTFLSAAVNALPTDIDLFANKLFSIVAFICLPILAFVLILVSCLFAFFLVGLFLELFGISISLPLLKKRKDDKNDN